MTYKSTQVIKETVNKQLQLTRSMIKAHDIVLLRV